MLCQQNLAEWLRGAVGRVPNIFTEMTVDARKCLFLHTCWWAEMQCYRGYDHHTAVLKYFTWKKVFFHFPYSPCPSSRQTYLNWKWLKILFYAALVSTVDAVLHMQIDEIVIKEGKKQQRSWEAWFSSTICSNKDWEAKLLMLDFFFHSVTVLLFNPTRGRQLFTPERTTGEERQYAKCGRFDKKDNRTPLEMLYFFKGAAVSLFPPRPYRHIPTFTCHSPSSSRELLQKCNINMRPQEWSNSSTWTCGFLSAQLIKIPGTKNAGCDVRRAGGVGLICMSGQLLHLQIGSHRALLSGPSAALLAYGVTEGIHEHSRGAGPTVAFTDTIYSFDSWDQ